MSVTDPVAPQVTAHQPASLVERAAAGELRMAVTFAGQGADALRELSTLVAQRPALRRGFDAAGVVLADLAASEPARASGAFRHGLDLARWVDDAANAPDSRYLHSSAVSYPVILLTQAMLWRALIEDGAGALAEAGALIGVAGHSQGLLAALLVSESQGGAIEDDVLARYLELALLTGIHTARAKDCGTGDEAPLVAISGVRSERLAGAIDAVNARVDEDAALSLALVNTPTRMVVAGPPATCGLLRAHLGEVAAREEADRRHGRRGGRPLRFTWQPLEVDVPFHSPALAPALAQHLGALARRPPLIDPAALALRVIDPATGQDLRAAADLPGRVARALFVEPERWDKTSRALVDLGADWVLDCGPGAEVARLTSENVRGTGARVLALASPEGRRVLVTPGAAPTAPDVRYADFAPGIVRLPDGRRHVDGRYARAAGRPPFVLPGMTPTTADAPIVAAAANAGFTAELAGGGQPDARTFERRIEELGSLLEPGTKIIFNTLVLDRELWPLHIEREGLLFRARRAGAPIAGLTVSAGIPEVDDGIALLDRLAACGMRHNAFKPGTAEQVRQVLAIADASPHHTIFVHLEGGKGGGHHSWEDLDDLLLDCYHDLRTRSNVVLCAGGGIGTPERAADLLTGSWSTAHGELPMPVDGVLLGTVAMACAEAAASPQVKAALVAAQGTSAWVERRGAAGGVSSGRSRLSADIHLLDNAAARAGHLVDELAGDAELVTARRDELIAALAATAKPYLGDLGELTYAELLRRFTSFCASGRGGRYDDGAWGDPGWRDKALALYRRFAARLAGADAGPITAAVAVAADLDDPAAALATFLAAYPSAGRETLHPSDAHYVLEVCDRPGKPVPFVPVLDAEIRRWFMGDALWQAQDDRYDADAVFVIPGPEAVAGIGRADEPVAELLARFENALLARLDGEDVVTAERDRLTLRGVAPAPVADLAGAHAGPLAALLVATSIAVREGGTVRSVPNPLWRLVRAGDSILHEVDDAGRLAAVTARPSPAEKVHAVVAGDDEVAVVVDTGAGAQRLRYRRLPGTASFEELGGEASRLAHARLALLGDDPPADDALALTVRPWVNGADLAGRYRAATGAEHEGVPLDLAFTLAWPALAALLGSDRLAPLFGDLVHASHGIRPGPAWPPRPGERGTAAGHVTLLDPHADPPRLACRTELTGERGLLAEVDAELVLRGSGAAALGDAVYRRREHAVELLLAGPAEAELLVAAPWLELAPATELSGGDRVTVRATTASVRRGGRSGLSASGVVTRAGEPIGRIALDCEASEPEHPVDAMLAVLAAPADPGRSGPRLELGRGDDSAPLEFASFAAVGGDRNPLHTSVLSARSAGLDGPIAHGLWTAARAAAFAVETACDGDASRLRDWRVRFQAPLEPGAALELQATRTGVRDHGRAVEIVASSGGVVVAVAEALIAPPRTALLFPGQGVQHTGLGEDGRARSRAARQVWARADACTRERLGWSLLDVVERNPSQLALADGRVRAHPSGVLFRTEFTQVALVALAAAQLAELQDDGAPLGTVAACGHSVGEYSALVALGALPLESALELVHLRGSLMQECVPRDATGASGFRLAVIDPSAADIADDDVARLVSEVAEASGEPLEVVNRNARGTQYAIAGTASGIEALGRRIGSRRAGGRQALMPVPGVDVPFHSSLLRPAVPAMREHLERLVPAIDPAALAGRWIPNLAGRPFADDDAFRAAIRPLVGERAAGDARALVIELLAHHLANPVCWIETHDALLAPRSAGGVGCARLLEVGPARAPVLAGLARAGIEVPGAPGRRPEILHSELDRERLLERDEPPPEEPEDVPPAHAPPVLRSPAAALAPDRPLDAGTALRLVLALQGRVRLDQLRDDETIDELFEGVSSRRNQVLIDLAREFGLTGSEGAAVLPLGQVVQELRERDAHYRYPGAYLRDGLGAGLTGALGRSRVSRGDALAYLGRAWGAGPGLAEHVLAILALETRAGRSARGGELGRLAGPEPESAAAAHALLDAAAALASAELGLALHPAEPAATAPATEPPGPPAEPAIIAGEPLVEPDPERERLSVLDAELGAERAAEVAPLLDARRHVRFASGWASARWDLVRLYHDAVDRRAEPEELAAEARRLAVHGDEPAVRRTAEWLGERAGRSRRPDVVQLMAAVGAARRSPLTVPSTVPALALDTHGALAARDVADAGGGRLDALLEGLGRDDPRAAVRIGDRAAAAAYAAALEASRERAPDLRGEVALVTGASPGSIAAELVRHLLRGGARVVVTTSTDTPGRRRWYRELQREAGGRGAELHVLPANLASLQDVDALCAWLERPDTMQRARPDLWLSPLVPTLVAPFAAMPTAGDASGAGARWETPLRLQLIGVERLIGGIAELALRRGAAPARILLPLSPNQGALGGDGPYGEAKAALQVLVRRWRSEQSSWGRAVRLLAPEIGWVRGTSLMGHSDALAALAEERLGLRTFSAAEMGWLLAVLATAPGLDTREPLAADLTGGLAAHPRLREALDPLVRELETGAATARRRAELARALAARTTASAAKDVVEALPGPAPATPARVAPAGASALDPADLVVIVGVGELGPCGTAATRFDIEVAGAPSAAGIGELAWLCGLVRYDTMGYRGRWLDTATDAEVDEADLAARYGGEVAARVGLRDLEDDGVVDPAGREALTTVHLDQDIAFEVGSEAEARSFAAADPGGTEVRRTGESTWRVVRRAGSPLRVPRLLAHTRRVAGQLPRGLDLARFGLPGDLLATADRMAMVNLACTSEAFADAGIEPDELLSAVHPALVANTQGSGLGGMASLRRLLLDGLLDAPRQGDRLQESLANVLAGHTVQSYVGSYGAMLHPVAACATAAVSLELGVDAIRSGKALVVLAGAYDDLTPEGLDGFGDMHATVASDDLEAMGLAPHEASRANDERRRGFVEAQGGGSLLLARGDVALALGLPVRGVLMYAASFADGIHASIPAPGMGLLAAALGGADSPLAAALARHGLSADDIAVVSKHDTSTELNDPNEADLHQRLQEALGRTPGNPLLVISQKSVTGHSKGGAAAWQVAGLLQAMEHGIVPGNRNLESVDPLLRPFGHLALGDRPVHLAEGEQIRAGLVSSLGFGHISALVAIAAPETFLAAVPPAQREDYLRRAGARRSAGRSRALLRRLGRGEPVRRSDRRLGELAPAAARAREAGVLTDPGARLVDSVYRLGET